MADLTLLRTRLDQLLLWLITAFPLAYFLIGRAAADGIAIAVGLAWLAFAVLDKNYTAFRARWFQAGLLFWAYLLIRDCFAPEFATAMGRAVSFGRYLFFAAGVWDLLGRYPSWQKRVLISLLMALGISTVDTLVQYLTGISLSGYPVSNYDRRLTGPSGKLIIGITMTWMSFPAIGWLLGQGLESGGVLWKRGAALLTAALFLLTILLSGESMATILAALGVLLLALLYAPKRKLLLGFGAVILTLGVLTSIFSPSINHRQERAVAIIGDFANTRYGALMSSGLRMWELHPLFGVGAKGFRSECPKHEYDPAVPPPVERCDMHPHNYVAELLAETGAIGFVLYAVMAFFWLRLLWQTRHVWMQDALAVGLAVSLLIKIWPFAATTSMFANWSALPLWFTLGFFLARLRTLSRA